MFDKHTSKNFHGWLAMKLKTLFANVNTYPSYIPPFLQPPPPSQKGHRNIQKERDIVRREKGGGGWMRTFIDFLKRNVLVTEFSPISANTHTITSTKSVLLSPTFTLQGQFATPHPSPLNVYDYPNSHGPPISHWIHLQSRCFFLGPIISSVVALQTDLAKPCPARLCLAASNRSFIVCPAIFDLLLLF